MKEVCCPQGVPEFVTRTEKTHLRMNAMSRSRSAEKVCPGILSQVEKS